MCGVLILQIFFGRVSLNFGGVKSARTVTSVTRLYLPLLPIALPSKPTTRPLHRCSRPSRLRAKETTLSSTSKLCWKLKRHYRYGFFMPSLLSPSPSTQSTPLSFPHIGKEREKNSTSGGECIRQEVARFGDRILTTIFR